MKTKLIRLAVAGFCAMPVGAAFAGDVQFDGSWYVMPVIGLMHADSDLDQSDNNDTSYGIRLGKQLSEHWDVQLGATHSKADTDYPSGFSGSGEYKQTLIGVDAMYMFSRDKFRPFVMAGFGAAKNEIDSVDHFNNSVNEDKWSPMANLGAGFQYLFNKSVGMQADLRYVWSKADAPNDAEKSFSGDKTIGNTYLNLGVFFNFGGKVAAAPAAPMAEPVSNLPEIAPYDDGTYEFIVEEGPAPVEEGPAPPAVKVTLAAEVLFDFDKAVLKDEGKNLLNTEIVEKMKAHPEAELVMVTGYTDRIGTEKYNQSLSERRANAVKDYIVSQGIEESRLKAAGKGEQDPVVDCKGVRGKKLIECLQPNRRVVVETEVQRTVEPAAAE
jgi:OmpA-OmpF porin, OOP family